ncbi:RNA polymerase sigma-70 factor [Butyricimonas synergistica]|uniref:RNA polymerase sigma-70 factor n=1 Tax=Butyricimonas synergistica TaxID=544644 RepID=UPI001D096843|nr:RNA polymerase sigma-70 factor [Butyricimonas synergistica]MCB6971671.1 RNA polymerase sigma-70 factor [Butyricimonas synergistica]
MELTDLSNPDDVHGLRKRDPRVYEIIFKKYYPKLLVFVNRHVGDQDVAQDIVQDIFFKLFESSRSLPDNFNLKSWLYKVARNAALDYLRHLQVIDRHKFLMADAMIVAEDVDESVDEEIYDRVNQAVESLPEQCRLIIKLNVIEGKKYLEISEELGISINTIRTQVSRGYKKLRDILSNERDTLILVIYIQ